MPQIPPIDDAYIDAIIKSAGPYNEAINKTQGVKLRELMKRFRDYFEQQVPTMVSQLTNDVGYVTASMVEGLANDSEVLHKSGNEMKTGNLSIAGNLEVTTDLIVNSLLGTGDRAIEVDATGKFKVSTASFIKNLAGTIQSAEFIIDGAAEIRSNFNGFVVRNTSNTGDSYLGYDFLQIGKGGTNNYTSYKNGRFEWGSLGSAYRQYIYAPDLDSLVANSALYFPNENGTLATREWINGGTIGANTTGSAAFWGSKEADLVNWGNTLDYFIANDSITGKIKAFNVSQVKSKLGIVEAIENQISISQVANSWINGTYKATVASKIATLTGEQLILIDENLSNYSVGIGAGSIGVVNNHGGGISVTNGGSGADQRYTFINNSSFGVYNIAGAQASEFKRNGFIFSEINGTPYRLNLQYNGDIPTTNRSLLLPSNEDGILATREWSKSNLIEAKAIDGVSQNGSIILGGSNNRVVINAQDNDHSHFGIGGGIYTTFVGRKGIDLLDNVGYTTFRRDGFSFYNGVYKQYINFESSLTNNRSLTFPDENGILATQAYVTANALDLINNQNVRGVKTFVEDGSTRKIAINNESLLFTRANDNMLGISTYAEGGYPSIPLVWVTNGFQTRLTPSPTGGATLSLPAENGTLETKEYAAANYASNSGTVLNKEGLENYYQAQATAVVNVKKGKFLEGIIIRDATTGEFGATSGLDLNVLSVGAAYIGINNGTQSFLQRFINNSSTYSEIKFDKNNNQLGYRKAGESGDDNVFELIRKKDLSNYLNIISSPAPTPTSSGIKGQIIIEGGYIYYCTATDKWARIPLEATW